MIQESELVLEWLVGQAAEITTEINDLEFLPILMNQERGLQNLKFVLQQVHTALMALTKS